MSFENYHLLDVVNLKTYFPTSSGYVRAVDDVSFHVDKNQVVGILGESGSGKSTLGLSIMRLIPEPGRIVSGKILFGGVDLASIPEPDMVKVRGQAISMVYQDPFLTLDPLFRVGDQIAEVFRVHKKLNKSSALSKSIDVMRKVGIPDAERRVNDYPHQLSGGLRQRISIAMALASEPQLLIADEPTTALDVTIQKQILDLIDDMKEEYHLSVLLISHDFGVLAERCDYVAVMYAGKIVEFGKVRSVLKDPQHPYTKALLNSIPNKSKREGRLEAIGGHPPALIGRSNSCAFNQRCPYTMGICRSLEPTLLEIKEQHSVRCHLYGK